MLEELRPKQRYNGPRGVTGGDNGGEGREPSTQSRCVLAEARQCMCTSRGLRFREAGL